MRSMRVSRSCESKHTWYMHQIVLFEGHFDKERLCTRDRSFLHTDFPQFNPSLLMKKNTNECTQGRLKGAIKLSPACNAPCLI